MRRNQEKALYMNGPYVLALTIAALITLVLCMNYLHKQASITTRINHIEDLELKLENLKSENDALQTRIDTYVDLDHVYKVATEELGMVYANKDQILLYDKTESEYVRQYEDIPKHYRQTDLSEIYAGKAGNYRPGNYAGFVCIGAGAL